MLALLANAALATGAMTPEPEPAPLIPTPVPWLAVSLVLIAVYVVIRLAQRGERDQRGSR